MTSLSLNTSNTSISTVLAIPTSATYGRKKNVAKGMFSYAISSKTGYRKPSVRFASADWDLNRNELEFE